MPKLRLMKTNENGKRRLVGREYRERCLEILRRGKLRVGKGAEFKLVFVGADFACMRVTRVTTCTRVSTSLPFN